MWWPGKIAARLMSLEPPYCSPEWPSATKGPQLPAPGTQVEHSARRCEWVLIVLDDENVLPRSRSDSSAAISRDCRVG